MTEEQQIEIWRNQFESAVNGTAQHELVLELLKCNTLDKMLEQYVKVLWQGFLLARRSMPVIDIPSYDLHHYAPVRNITAQMDDAGIKYKIKL